MGRCTVLSGVFQADSPSLLLLPPHSAEHTFHPQKGPGQGREGRPRLAAYAGGSTTGSKRDAVTHRKPPSVVAGWSATSNGAGYTLHDPRLNPSLALRKGSSKEAGSPSPMSATMATLRRHQRQPHPQPQQRVRSSSSMGQRRLEDPSLYAHPQAQADKMAYWGCALPCCGALVLSALHHHHHHHHQQQQQRHQQQRQQWQEKGANNEGGLRSQQQQAAALSLLRLGVLSEVRAPL